MMHKTKKYEVGKTKKDEQAKQKKFEGILKQLTPLNFEELLEQVKAIDIDNAGTLRGVVAQIYEKSLMEPTFCEMCANFCFHLSGELPDFSEYNEKITFKRLLLNKCQEEFERGEREQEEANKADEEGEEKQSEEEREEKRIKARRRMLGNIRLIGELYKKNMLTERIMHECIKKLLGQHQTPDEEDVEALCVLMSTIGEIIDHPKAEEHMDAYFDCMKILSNNMKLSSKARLMLKDTIDLRKNKWQQIRRVEVCKTGDEEEAKQRQLRAILNKLTPTKFSKLLKQVIYVEMDNAKTLLGLVGQIVDRAPMEPTFCEVYANFCYHLSVELLRFCQENENISFKRLLAIKCQKEFEKGERLREEANKVDEESEVKQSKEEREAKIIKGKRRMLGHIKFVGELYKKKMLTERIMHHCIRKLLHQHHTPHEENLEALCILISTIGEIIDQPKSKALIDEYLEKMETLSNNIELTSRIRFMLKDAIDLRKNQWQQRRRIEGPKEIQEIHYDVAQRRQEKSCRQGCGLGINLSRSWEPSKDHFTRGSAVLFSPSFQLGSQNVHLDVGQPFEATTLSAPLTKRPVCGDASTFLSQDGISRVVSSRGSLSPSFSSLADSPRKDLIPRMWLEELQEKSKAAIKEFYRLQLIARGSSKTVIGSFSSWFFPFSILTALYN
ncbi:eukaryotic translation initiation factor 4G-like isoform X2 [Humulus lupulus]|uniref:eukaryotic translation initiation factor 4G-like isoform X2 n=1 Tax=Humulus lupulus TaxID=3486 RepID=UPI002B409B2B|nr:eukaryotic translation initiation factor 4G-like isoform X2 [Humulus lupulus]